MPNLLIICDEKWPIYELEIPEEGQTSNCEVDENFFIEYLYVSLQYSKMQEKLKRIYDERKLSE